MNTIGWQENAALKERIAALEQAAAAKREEIHSLRNRCHAAEGLLTLTRADLDELRSYIVGALPFLEEAWAACFGDQKQKMLSAEERGMGRLLMQFRAIAKHERVLPPDLVTAKEAREQFENATAWACRTLGNPNELRPELREWMRLGETCADGIARADAEVRRLRAVAASPPTSLEDLSDAELQVFHVAFSAGSMGEPWADAIRRGFAAVAAARKGA